MTYGDPLLPKHVDSDDRLQLCRDCRPADRLGYKLRRSPLGRLGHSCGVFWLSADRPGQRTVLSTSVVPNPTTGRAVPIPVRRDWVPLGRTHGTPTDGACLNCLVVTGHHGFHGSEPRRIAPVRILRAGVSLRMTKSPRGWRFSLRHCGAATATPQSARKPWTV